MKRFLVFVGGAAAATAVLYMALTAADLPDRIPMQYGGDGETTWYADRGRFWFFLLVPWALTALVFLAFSARYLSVAFGFALVNVMVLLVYDLTREQAEVDSALGLSPNWFVLIAAVGMLVLFAFAIRDKYASHPSGRT